MIIHAYFTNGFFPWAELFLASYKFYNGSDKKIVLSTRELTDDQVKSLYLLYSNLDVINEPFDINMLAKKARVNKKELLKLKRQVEKNHVNDKNKVWKLMIAADDRVKSILKVMKSYRNEDFLLHFDIDM